MTQRDKQVRAVMRAIIADLRNRAGIDHMVDEIARDKPVRTEVLRDWRRVIGEALEVTP